MGRLGLHPSVLSFKPPPQPCVSLDQQALRETAASHRRKMSFHGGLAASPDPSNDVVYSTTQEHSVPHRLLEDARNDVEHGAAGTPQHDDENQAGLLSFDYTGRDLDSLPYDLADTIKDHAARLALGNNRLTGLSGFGPRMGEFKQLTYLVLRHNWIRDFPRDASQTPDLAL